ncbi:MAG: hypothetical protein ACM3WU_10015 [Bacillota bacterium]
MPDVTVFYGLYGSGKTEISINYALSLKKQGMDVTIVDLDAVTPYFRVRDVRDYLVKEGIVVVAPKESVRHADLPVLPEGVRTALGRENGAVVIDVGGDPTGARVLGGLSDALSREAKGYFVVNSRRPFTRTVEDAQKAVEKISSSAGLPATGLVANTHLTDETTVEDVVFGVEFARELGGRIGLPVVFCAAPKDLELHKEEIAARTQGLPVLWLTRFLKKPWEVDEQ